MGAQSVNESRGGHCSVSRVACDSESPDTKEYLEGLISYLRGFLLRTQPLVWGQEANKRQQADAVHGNALNAYVVSQIDVTKLEQQFEKELPTTGRFWLPC